MKNIGGSATLLRVALTAACLIAAMQAGGGAAPAVAQMTCPNAACQGVNLCRRSQNEECAFPTNNTCVTKTCAFIGPNPGGGSLPHGVEEAT